MHLPPGRYFSSGIEEGLGHTGCDSNVQLDSSAAQPVAAEVGGSNVRHKSKHSRGRDTDQHVLRVMTMPIANANVTASCQLVISPLQAAHPEATCFVCLRQGAGPQRRSYLALGCWQSILHAGPAGSSWYRGVGSRSLVKVSSWEQQCDSAPDPSRPSCHRRTTGVTLGCMMHLSCRLATWRATPAEEKLGNRGWTIKCSTESLLSRSGDT